MRSSILVIVSGVALLLASSSVSSQPIFRPFTGERGIEMVRDYDSRYRNLRWGAPCGEYFFYEEVTDQKIVSFIVPVTKQEARIGTNSLLRIGRRKLDIQIDDTKQIPTAEWVLPGRGESPDRTRMIIRISSRDYAAAPCLAGICTGRPSPPRTVQLPRFDAQPPHAKAA